MRSACFSFALLLAFGGIVLGAAGRSAADLAPTTRAGAYFEHSVPHQAGHYRIMFHDDSGKAPVEMMTVFSVSDHIAVAKGKVPLLVFLCGVGERGSNGNGVFYNGPAGEMERRPGLKKDLPILCLSPQCPQDRRWDEPAMVQAVVSCIETAKKNPWVDGSRIYLTGLSMGGKGTWLVAEAAPHLFAAVVPISAVAEYPRRAAAKLTHLPIWIVDGLLDRDSCIGSRQMASALIWAGGDVMLSEVPDIGHNVWVDVYNHIEFYQWLALARQGQTSIASRPTQPELDAVLSLAAGESEQQLTRDFEQFAPYWMLINCANNPGRGLKGGFHGKRNVFMTFPLAADIPAVLRTTWAIPAGHKAKLVIVAGPQRKGEWKLIVHVNGKEALWRLMNSRTCRNGWMENSIDLSAYAGQAVNLEVIDAATGPQNAGACWARVAVEVE